MAAQSGQRYTVFSYCRANPNFFNSHTFAPAWITKLCPVAITALQKSWPTKPASAVINVLCGKQRIDRLLDGLVIDYNPFLGLPVLMRRPRLLSGGCGQRRSSRLQSQTNRM
jgi:hypothetical protein